MPLQGAGKGAREHRRTAIHRGGVLWKRGLPTGSYGRPHHRRLRRLPNLRGPVRIEVRVRAADICASMAFLRHDLVQ